MHKKLPTDIQNSIKVLLENSDDPAVIGKRVGVHRNTVNRVNTPIHQEISAHKLFEGCQGRANEVGGAAAPYVTIHDWRRVIFSDETKINIWCSDGCKYYWKRKCDRLHPQHIDVTVKHGGGGLMLWGCITSEGPGYAYQIYDGTMNSEVYQEILDTSLKDTMEYYDLNWETSVFQHDNDPKHRSKFTTQLMKDSGMIYIDN
ncbi:hypothetical protein G6F46_012264 [Rhizopus delemar]|uniref:Tc1-like transposase DDE domain-containing protein n=2 Tax=Rhizopus TaxID=4842 RepID=A0A9P7CJX1_9FUNG|nr:hypothetical protein G6F55_012295 [Rhizopus delemar]KAG1534775.1 hypothetical protein G6F51_011906 [Rhizopus arrhizus]KAG1489013.1 hypothetical protein G6F54_011742 [Rhizopus delemar]KAG1498443.1 hypothetical protein G6F53_011739 [Rhizopus delemar]KAG1507963.1 hypothetical protein G6F52_011507 [Rhizopus delemar]